MQYRRLFKRDDDFHPADRPQEERDNWLVGKEWYLDAIDSVDNKGFSLGRKSPRDFYSSPAKSQMNYAEAIEEEGFFRQGPPGVGPGRRRVATIRQHVHRALHRREDAAGHAAAAGKRSCRPARQAGSDAARHARGTGQGEAAGAHRRKNDKSWTRRPKNSRRSRARSSTQLQEKTTVTDRDVAERIAREQPADEKQALQLANDLDRTAQELQYTINYKRDANYDYWQTRADFEQTDNALAAREFMFDARQAFEDADLPRAKQLYQQGFAKWRLVIDEFPSILEDDQTTGDDILEFVKKYRDVLDQLDERLDDDFPLWDVIEKFDREQEFTEEKAERRERLGLPPEETTAPAQDRGCPCRRYDAARSTGSAVKRVDSRLRSRGTGRGIATRCAAAKCTG